MLLLIFAFLHPFIDNFNCSDQKHRNTLFHIKTNLCNGSQIIIICPWIQYMNLLHSFFQKGSCIESTYLRKETKTFYQTRTFACPLVCTHHGHGWVKKILPDMYHNSTLCSLTLKVKPTLSFGPLIICGTFVGFSLGQRLIGKMHFRKALIAS